MKIEGGPIGVFDSGYGGLTILKDIMAELPQYDYIYLGDNARAPYGTRSFDVVYDYTLEAVKELFSRGCQLVIIACNTASAKALRTIQQKDLPHLAPDRKVLGVIRPSTERIHELTQSKHVGVLATEGTVRSNSYEIEINKFHPEIKVHQLACPMWVPLIENEQQDSVPGRMFIEEDVRQLLHKDPKIDVILLGCTHYPIVRDYIQSKVGDTVKVVAQGKLIAKSLQNYLYRHPEIERHCTKQGTINFLTSESTEDFDRKAEKFIGSRVKSQHIKW